MVLTYFYFYGWKSVNFIIKYVTIKKFHAKYLRILTYYSSLKNTWHFLMNELLLLKKFIMQQKHSHNINFFNSNNSFIKKCQLIFNGL